MKIRRLIFRGIRSIKEFDYSLEDSFSGRVFDSVLLIGPNGGGKTTALNLIAGLWSVFQDTFTLQKSQSTFDELLIAADYAAIEIVDLDAKPIWISVDHGLFAENTFSDNIQNPDSHRLRINYSRPTRKPTSRVGIMYAEPGSMQFKVMKDPNDLPIWLIQLADRLQRNIFRASYDLPNLVYLESETRLLRRIKGKFVSTPEPRDEYGWLHRYQPTESRRGSLQNFLYNLKVVDEQAYTDIVQQINRFLPSKELSGFDRSGNLMVKVDEGNEHPIEELSSGEKQVLLMVASIARWLRPGGILLIDEPDLHLHRELTRSLVRHLRQMIETLGGQMIVASHAKELWDLFSDENTLRLGIKRSNTAIGIDKNSEGEE